MTRRIGVNVSTGTRSGPSNTGSPAGILHIVGITEKGPTSEAVTISSFANYQNVYGARAPYAGTMFDSARLFFEEGGAELLVSRAVGPDAQSASVDLLTPSGEDPGEPVVRISAGAKGSFGNSLSVTVASETSGEYTIRVLDADGESIARWNRVTSITSLVEAASNNPDVTIESLGESGEELSLDTGEFDLEGGDDDRDNINTESLIEALQTADNQGEGGAVAAPGYPADVVGTELVHYASASHKIALLSPEENTTVAEAALLGNDLSGSVNGSSAGLFYPHLRIPDGSGSRTVSPEAYVAAVRARAFQSGEFWEVPAGTQKARARWVSGTTVAINSEKLDQLDEANVNGIVTNGAIYLNNWSSLSEDRENFDLLKARDVLNNLKVLVRRALEPYVWATIDGRGQLLGQIHGEITGILSPIADANGFFAELNSAGEELNPGYRVVVDTTNNTVGSLARNELFADVSVKLSPVAKRINVEIVKVPLTAAL